MDGLDPISSATVANRLRRSLAHAGRREWQVPPPGRCSLEARAMEVHLNLLAELATDALERVALGRDTPRKQH